MAIPILAILGGVAGGMGLATMLPPVSRAISYPLNRLWRNEVIDVAEALELRLRQKIDAEMLNHELGSKGYDQARIELLQALKQQLLQVAELVTLWRREQISDDDLYNRAAMVGFVKEDVDLMVKLSEMIPMAQDVIRFAVREVYTPEIAEKFGQFEGADQVIATASKDLKAAGVPDDTLRKYWAAHWVLPSPEQGFEMLHRGVIDMDTLKLLLRALDVMPFYRDKLIQIAYQPYTRVDVRRMHKLGILSDADLVKSYKDLGYDDEHAANMAKFTIEYNKAPENSEQTADDQVKAKERDLTKSDFLDAYEEGVFTEDEVREGLATIGYSDDEIDYYLTKVEFKKDREMTQKYLKSYHDAYVSGVMGYNEIVDALGKLNLSGLRIETLFNLWDLDKQIRVAKPTKAELLTFLRKGVITKETAVDELLGLGYSQKYISWYMATA